MFEDIREYMKKTRDERRSHLNLKEDCIEIGGYDSREYRGLLAHYLKTTIPTNVKVVLCHGCHNNKCSNPKHLYWGTYEDNIIDQKENGTFKTVWEHTVSKYGEDEAKRIASESASKAGKKGGGHNKLTDSKIAEYKEVILSSDCKKIGWISRASRKMNVSHTQIKRVYDTYFKDKIEVYSRK